MFEFGVYFYVKLMEEKFVYVCKDLGIVLEGYGSCMFVKEE